MSFLQQLQEKRLMLKDTTTIVTRSTGERFIESRSGDSVPLQERVYGFVVDTKPDAEAACILDKFLYLGSQDAVTVDNIKNYNLTHILSVGIETPNLDVAAIQSTAVPCTDLPETQLFPFVVQQSIDFIENARKCKGCVLVHCNAGVSRSASVVIAFLMQQRNMNFEDAYALVKSKRECIQPNRGFVQQLKQFEKIIKNQ